MPSIVTRPASRITPISTGWSRARTASNVSRPMPGRPKMRSTITAPETSAGSVRPKSAIRLSSEFGSAWRRITVASEWPRERAERVAQVAADQVPQPAEVAGQQRLVEPHQPAVLAQLRERDAADAEVALHGERIAGGISHDGEGEEGDAEQREDTPRHGRASQT